MSASNRASSFVWVKNLFCLCLKHRREEMTHTIKDLKELYQNNGALIQDLKFKNEIDSFLSYQEDEEGIDDVLFNKFSQRLSPTVVGVSGGYLDAVYPGNLRFSDFSGLTKVSTDVGRSIPTYVLFNEEMVKDFDLNCVERFAQLLKNDLSFCAGAGQSGIKFLGGSKISIKANINGHLFEAPMKSELKPIGVPERVGLYELKPIRGQGPTILVAACFFKDGLHGDKDRQKKTITVPAMTVEPKSPRVSQSSGGLFGLPHSPRVVSPSKVFSKAA
jgi:hypothetical protein